MKKILILLTLFTAFLVADDGFQILVNTPEEVDSMSAILNGLAMLFKNDGYLTLLKFIFVIGSFVILFNWALSSSDEGAAKKGLGTYLKYNMGVVAILTIAFSSVQTSMWVKSKTFPSLFSDSSTATTGTKVDNIPYVVAVGIYGLNHFGESLTELYQQAMAPIGNYSLNRDGYASSLRDSLDLLTLDLGNTDQKLGDAIDVLVSQCVYIPFSSKMGGEGYIEKLRSSKNLKATFDHWYNDDVEVGGIKAKDYTASFMGKEWKCGDLWQYVKDNMSDFNDKAEASLNRIDSRDIAMITGLHSGITSSNFDEIALQSGIVNSVLNNKDIGSGISYASGKSQSEFIQENIGAGYYMAKMLPVMQTIFRALIYALFPAILAISLLPGGWLILKNYMKTAVWIELWGVISAILNFFISKYGEKILSANGDASHHTISSYSVVHMVDNASSLAGVAGYLYLMVPGIAWGLMSGSFNMLEGIGKGLGSGITKNMGTDMVARDQKKLAMKEAASAQAGEDLSYAEAMHFEQVAAGMKEGTEVGVLKNQGLANVANMASYNATKPFAELRRKEAFAKAMGKVGGGAGIAELEANSAAMSLAKNTGSYDAGKGDANTFHTVGEVPVVQTMATVGAIGLGGIATNAAGSALEQNGRINQIGLGNMKNIGAMAGQEAKSKYDAVGISGAGTISAGNALHSLGVVQGRGGEDFQAGLGAGKAEIGKLHGSGGPNGMGQIAFTSAQKAKGESDAISGSAYHIGNITGHEQKGHANELTGSQAEAISSTKTEVDKGHYLNMSDPYASGQAMAASANAMAGVVGSIGMNGLTESEKFTKLSNAIGALKTKQLIEDGGDTVGSFAAEKATVDYMNSKVSQNVKQTLSDLNGGTEGVIQKLTNAEVFSTQGKIGKDTAKAQASVKMVEETFTPDRMNEVFEKEKGKLMSSNPNMSEAEAEQRVALGMTKTLSQNGLHSSDIARKAFNALTNTVDKRQLDNLMQSELGGDMNSIANIVSQKSENIKSIDQTLSHFNELHKNGGMTDSAFEKVSTSLNETKEKYVNEVKQLSEPLKQFSSKHSDLIKTVKRQTASALGTLAKYGAIDNKGNFRDTRTEMANMNAYDKKVVASKIQGINEGKLLTGVDLTGAKYSRTTNIAGSTVGHTREIDTGFRIMNKTDATLGGLAEYYGGVSGDTANIAQGTVQGVKDLLQLVGARKILSMGGGKGPKNITHITNYSNTNIINQF